MRKLSVKQNTLANKNVINLIKTGLLALIFISSSVFAFTDLEGNNDSISKYIGKDKWTIVEIWETNCPACRMHMPSMVKFDGKLDNTRILGVSLDTKNGIEAVEDFIDEFEIKFPTIITNYIEMNIWMEKSIGESLVGTPTFILFDPSGKIVAAQPGMLSTESIEKFILQNSKPAQATNESTKS